MAILEVAFRLRHVMCVIWDGADLPYRRSQSNLYTISISGMAASSPVCLMSKATSTKSSLWHRRLSRLNFGTINDLIRLNLVCSSKVKKIWRKDSLCSACERGKSKKASHPLKLVPSDHSKLELLHMDLCGQCRLKKALYGLKQAPRAWGDILLVQVYVDDIIFGSTNPYFSKRFANLMKNNFEMSMMGELKFFLGLQVHQSPRGIFIIYNMGLWYPKDSGFELIAYSDADHAGCKDDCKSTSGGLQFLGGKLVSWSSKKQDCTAMSTAEAEYVSLSACCAQVIWMRTQLLDYGYKYNRIPMYCDSKSGIAISCNPVQHSKTKHIDIRYHFIKEHVRNSSSHWYEMYDSNTVGKPDKIIIMAQQQHAADVHPDELCPPNKRYDLMDANKKVDLEHFLHTLKEDGSKYRLTFMLDKKELSLTLDDFRTIFHLPQANADNHDSFVIPPSFLDMVPFFKQQLGFTMDLKTSSSFKTTSLLQPWQTLYKIFSKCLTTRVTGYDQPPLQIMQMMYCFVNNIHVDYAELLWEGLYYSLHHPTSSIPYLRLTKIIISHYMTSFPEISSVLRQEIHTSYSTAPVLTIDKADEMILQDTLQVNGGRIREFIDDSLLHRNDEPNSGTRGGRISEDEITDEVYELKRREKGKIVEESKSTLFPTPIRSPRIHTDLGHYTYLFEHLKAQFMSRKSFDTLADHLQEVMVESLPTMIDTHIKEQVKKQVPEQVRDQVPVYVAEGLILERQKTKEEMEWMIAKAILQERGNIQAKISSQIQKSIDKHIPSQVDASLRSYMSGNILHVHPAQSQTLSIPEQQYQLYLSMKYDPQLQQQDIAIWLALQIKFENLQVNENEQGPSTSGNQEQEDDYDFWTESYASDDDEIPTKQMSQDIMEYVSLTIDEAKLKKMVDEIWVNKYVKKFNPYARYGVEHWKNPLEKIFYIRKQKEPGKPKEVIYSNSKIIQVIKTYWELVHEHKFITEIVARIANECIMSITEPDYKNLNKNDIEDMYLLIMNGKVSDYAKTGLLWSLSVFIRSSVIWEKVPDFQLGIENYQQKVNLTAPTISFPGVEKHKMFSIIYEPVHGIIYKNSKKEKRVMRHSEIHKFCDATLNRVLEGLRSYNNDVKYGYIQRDLTNEEVEYLKLFEEEIEVRLKYRNQMRRWEMYVNGRPLGPRRERPE
ncbi:retrovirus-related pol polyprotein from transposon TNT 1-94 [Tanacetum coccineum]